VKELDNIIKDTEKFYRDEIDKISAEHKNLVQDLER